MIKSLIEQGIAQKIQEGDEKEATKVGTLRAGNTGMIDEHGNIIGACAANAYLRMKGIKISTVTPNKMLMFDGGLANEDIWLDNLKRVYKDPILCEEEIATCWTTSSGVKVTGRPDVVLCKEDRTPLCGIELKQVMSVNSAYGAYVAKEPQLKHLMQAAHYMWQVGCPFELWYTNRSNLDLPAWMAFREFPKPTEEEQVIQYRYYRLGKINARSGKPTKHKITREEYLQGGQGAIADPVKILPFLQGFLLQLDERGQLYYKPAEQPKAGWQQSIVNIEGIQRFYEFVSEMDHYGKVPKEVLNLTATGKKMGWTMKDYSDLGDLDAGHNVGRPLQKWVDKLLALKRAKENT